MRKFLSAPYWVHLIIDIVIGQFVWWIISMIIETPILVQSIIAGLILIATIVAVAWYLPKLHRKIDKDVMQVPTKEPEDQSAPVIFSPFSNVHKCSNCGWGIEVTLLNKMLGGVITCPKCGNVWQA